MSPSLFERVFHKESHFDTGSSSRLPCRPLQDAEADSVFPLMVLEPEVGRVQRIQDYTSLYKRFDDVVGVTRIYCRPEQAEQAKQLIGA